MTCAKCGQPIKPGQLYVVGKGIHVSCPSEREVEHDDWLRRAQLAYTNGRLA